MSVPKTYLEKSVASAEILTSRWFKADTPNNWVPNDYWRTPTICIELIELMRATGKASFVDTVKGARTAGHPYLKTSSYYDDLSVWGRFLTRAYRYLKDEGLDSEAKPFLTDAKTVYEQLGGVWGDPCGGGVWWKRYPPSYTDGNFKAANASLGYAEVAIDLYALTGEKKYLDNAQTAWKWIEQKKLVDDKGLVWGGLDQSCTPDPSNKPVIAQQGNPLGPLWGLYAATGDVNYLKAATQIIDGALDMMTWPNTGIFCTRDDAAWRNQSPTWQDAHSGATLFKGIFSRYLGAFTANLAGVDDPEFKDACSRYTAALCKNANTVWANFPAHIYGMDWHTPEPHYQPSSDPTINACLQYSGVAVLLAAAQVERR